MLGTIAVSLVLAACGGSTPTTPSIPTNLPGIGDIPDAGQMEQAGQEVAAAAAECSAGSAKMSEELQILTQAIRDKDLEAAKATAPVFQDAAAQMEESATKGMAAAQAMGDLPTGGDIAQKGTETAFKVCTAIAGFASDLATKVATADSSKAFKELEGAANDMAEEISKAASEMSSSIGG
jgi:hypothetical protein